MAILQWFKEKAKVYEEQKLKRKALDWWWFQLNDASRLKLDAEYVGGINIFPDSGCDGSIIDIYQREVGLHINSSSYRFTRRLISLT